ncbi:MAG: autotransporter-associated beta strand repeat-containing protein, partial [Kiritimatiellae bacterium]|nr:autotransporter-associated beta strand repeat-containing protein [Kiritimatiellia bacterium]
SSRYLTGKYDEIVYTNYSQNLWWNAVTASKLKKPRLATADNGLTGPYVDFGLSGSWKTLYFDPVTNGGVCTPSNIISGIGTIVGVYRSYNGGGNILGGSQFRRYTDYWGLRGTNFSEAVVAGGNNNDFITSGTFWSGLQKSAPSSTFWSGGWQVIALNPVSADAVVHGLCGNCDNHDEACSSGDQGIAELMLFDRVLSDSDITNLIVHLERKWLGRSPVGYNGNASISWLEIGGAKPPHGSNAANYPQNGVDVPVTVSSGDTLTVDRLTGGRSSVDRKHRVVKDGSGTLHLKEASSFGGTVNVREGTLAVGARPTPALSDLAPGLCLRFDPSESGSVTLEDDFVSAMENLGDSGKYSVRAVQANASLRPGFVANAPASGLNMVDFKTGDAAGGKCLRFETASAPQIGTLVLVVDSSTYTGAHFMNGMFPMRTTETARYFVYDQWNLAKALFFTPNDVYINSKHASMSPLVYGSAWVNGRRVAHETEAYDVPGINVVALRVPAAGVTMLGGYSESMCGGMRIGEVLGWKSELSDEQIRDAQAYLMNKWLLRPAPGYAPTLATGVADLQEVVAEENSRIHVPEGETATIAHLAASGTVYKTGSGTLRLQRSTDTEMYLVVKEGGVERAAPADVSETCEIAADPTLHFDPSQSWSVRTKSYNGTNFVWTLLDSCGLVCATESMQ